MLTTPLDPQSIKNQKIWKRNKKQEIKHKKKHQTHNKQNERNRRYKQKIIVTKKQPQKKATTTRPTIPATWNYQGVNIRPNLKLAKLKFPFMTTPVSPKKPLDCRQQGSTYPLSLLLATTISLTPTLTTKGPTYLIIKSSTAQPTKQTQTTTTQTQQMRHIHKFTKPNHCNQSESYFQTKTKTAKQCNQLLTFRLIRHEERKQCNQQNAYTNENSHYQVYSYPIRKDNQTNLTRIILNTRSLKQKNIFKQQRNIKHTTKNKRTTTLSKQSSKEPLTEMIQDPYEEVEVDVDQSLFEFANAEEETEKEAPPNSPPNRKRRANGKHTKQTGAHTTKHIKQQKYNNNNKTYHYIKHYSYTTTQYYITDNSVYNIRSAPSSPSLMVLGGANDVTANLTTTTTTTTTPSQQLSNLRETVRKGSRKGKEKEKRYYSTTNLEGSTDENVNSIKIGNLTEGEIPMAIEMLATMEIDILAAEHIFLNGVLTLPLTDTDAFARWTQKKNAYDGPGTILSEGDDSDGKIIAAMLVGIRFDVGYVTKQKLLAVIPHERIQQIIQSSTLHLLPSYEMSATSKWRVQVKNYEELRELLNAQNIRINGGYASLNVYPPSELKDWIVMAFGLSTFAHRKELYNAVIQLTREAPLHVDIKINSGFGKYAFIHCYTLKQKLRLLEESKPPLNKTTHKFKTNQKKHQTKTKERTTNKQNTITQKKQTEKIQNKRTNSNDTQGTCISKERRLPSKNECHQKKDKTGNAGKKENQTKDEPLKKNQEEGNKKSSTKEREGKERQKREQSPLQNTIEKEKDCYKEGKEKWKKDSQGPTIRRATSQTSTKKRTTSNTRTIPLIPILLLTMLLTLLLQQTFFDLPNKVSFHPFKKIHSYPKHCILRTEYNLKTKH